MEHFSSVQDFEDHALSILPDELKKYYIQGAGSHQTVKFNTEALKKLRIHPKLMRNVSNRNISTIVLGETVSMPLGISPTGYQKLAHPEGECANAKAAEAAETIYILPVFANSSIQEVTEAAPRAIKWLQINMLKDRDCVVHVVRRAEEAGFKAIVLTIDDATIPKSKSSKMLAFDEKISLRIYQDYFETKFAKEDIGNIFERIKPMFDGSATWSDLLWLKSITKLPIVVKGVLRPDDALLAVEHGASGILVSNHGGRQLDSAAATIEVLLHIVKAVGDKAEVYMDGGIRRGTDVFKAMALGAKMVFMGRPLIWGLVCGGQQGARAVLEVMRNEIDETFALTGCSNVQDVTRDFITHELEHVHF